MASFISIPGGVGQKSVLVRAKCYPGKVQGAKFYLYENLAAAAARQGSVEIVDEEKGGIERAVSRKVAEVAMVIAKPIVKFFRPSPAKRVNPVGEKPGLC